MIGLNLFADIDSAYEFIGKVLEGWDPTPTGIQSVSKETIQIQGIENAISFSNMYKAESAQVYDTAGRHIAQATVYNSDIKNIKKGFYIVKIGDQTHKVIVK